jgi:hypothetical protein
VIAADAPDPVIGTWKLNTAKSTGTTLPKSETRTYAASAAGGIVLTWKRVGPNTVDSTQKRMGKAVGTTRRTVSKDGKTLTLVSKLTNAKGEVVNTTVVYDRQ